MYFISMSDEVIKFVIIEKTQNCDSAVSPRSFAGRRRASGSRAGMEKAAGRENGIWKFAALILFCFTPEYILFLIQHEEG